MRSLVGLSHPHSLISDSDIVKMGGIFGWDFLIKHKNVIEQREARIEVETQPVGCHESRVLNKRQTIKTVHFQ